MFHIPPAEKYRPVRETLAAIEAMIILPLLPAISIQLVSIVKSGGDGAYVRQRGGLPVRIEIAEDAEYLELTAAHEIAHYLDNCGFGLAEAWTSETDPRLEPLRQAWEETEAVRALRAGLETGQMTAVLPRGGLAEFPLMQAEKDNCRYYLQGRELFARSFAQYLAAKSASRVLSQQIVQRRESMEGRLYHVQWSESDFQVITEAFDRILEELKWLR